MTKNNVQKLDLLINTYYRRKKKKKKMKKYGKKKSKHSLTGGFDTPQT